MKKFTMFFALSFGIIFMTQAQQKTGSQSPGTSNRQPESEIKKADKQMNQPQGVSQSETKDIKLIKEETPYFYVYGYDVQQRMELLESRHKSFFSLPYPEDYIRNTVMPSIRSERVMIAPNFPLRSSDKETDKRNLNQWLRDYTQEYINYLTYLDDKYISLKRAVTE